MIRRPRFSPFRSSSRVWTPPPGDCSSDSVPLDPADQQPRTRAGWGYAIAWSAVTGAKILLTYAITTWFPHDVGRFMVAHQLTRDSIRAAFIFLALGSPPARPAYLWIGGTRYANAHGHKLRLLRSERQAAVSASCCPQSQMSGVARSVMPR